MMDRDFDWGMHYFRAFAILAIMACHYAAVYGYEKLDKIVFTSSTAYFLFISGYLCQFLHTKRPDRPLAYYRKKVVNVICPFLVFSILFGIFKGEISFSVDFVVNVLMGRMQLQYWYIPFVSLLFLASPGICRLGNGALFALTGIAALLFLLFPYRIPEFTLKWPGIFYQYTYFTFFYVFGFLYCRHKARFEEIIKRYWAIFTAVALLVLVLLWNGGVGGIKCANTGIAINLQRLMMIFVALGLLQKIRDKKVWLLDNLAKFSFTLYFVHLGLLFVLEPARLKLVEMIPLPAIFTDLSLYCVFVLSMLVAAMGLKRVLGKYSRPLIGA